MIKKIKTQLGLFYITFLLSIFTLEVTAETKIIAKSGDNLLKISKQYGVPLKELMYKNNFNDAAKIIEGEVISIPLKKNSKVKKNGHINHKIVKGDTLYKIAKSYNVKIKDIISINNLSNNSYLKIDQIILLPKGAIYTKSNINGNIELASKNVFYHQTSKTEDLSTIAKIHKISREEIINLNKSTDPLEIIPNIKLKLKNNKNPRWLKYGSLMVNWSDWTYFDGNYIAQAKTKKDTSFYFALNCKRRTLNNTLNNPYWTSWYFPKTDFEFKLIYDFCAQDLIS